MVEGLTKRFGSLAAVSDVSFALRPGYVTAMIGPNGAGKSTVINMLSGTLVPTSGAVGIMGRPIVGLGQQQIAALGLARTFQTPRLFEGMTLLETVMLARDRYGSRAWLIGAALRTPRAWRDERESREQALAWLAYVGLAEDADVPAVSLTTGKQRLAELARALATEPTVLLLDEPAAGLDGTETRALGPDHQEPRRRGHRRAARRARHGHGDGHRRPHRRARGGPQDRRGLARRRSATTRTSSTPTSGWCTHELPHARERDGRLRRVTVLRDVSLEVAEGEIVAILGANGAGKSTLLKTVVGLIKPAKGRIEAAGEDITGMAPEKVTRHQVVLVPEGRQLFDAMTIKENLTLGGYTQPRSNRQADLRRVFDLFPILAERQGQKASSLSGGQRQMVAIGRALMARPRLLLLDEPSLGLAPLVIKETFETLGRLRDDGVTILVVEQNAMMTLELADRAYVLGRGKVSMQGRAQDLAQDPRIREAYLGLGATTLGAAEARPPRGAAELPWT